PGQVSQFPQRTQYTMPSAYYVPQYSLQQTVMSYPADYTAQASATGPFEGRRRSVPPVRRESVEGNNYNTPSMDPTHLGVNHPAGSFGRRESHSGLHPRRVSPASSGYN